MWLLIRYVCNYLRSLVQESYSIPSGRLAPSLPSHGSSSFLNNIKSARNRKVNGQLKDEAGGEVEKELLKQ